MIELELTYLAKHLPPNLASCESKEIIDLYVENGTDHADLRIRKNGDVYELTRKIPVEDGDASKQTETTITLNEAEFNSFAQVQSRKVAKTRYFYPYSDMTASLMFLLVICMVWLWWTLNLHHKQSKKHLKCQTSVWRISPKKPLSLVECWLAKHTKIFRLRLISLGTEPSIYNSRYES